MSYDIVIEPYSEQYVIIRGNNEKLRPILERFSFYAPSFQHHPAYKNRFWDGKVKLLNPSTQRLFKGLVPALIEFLESKGWTYTPQEKQVPTFSIDPEDFLKTVQTGGRTPREYQKASFLAFCNNKRNLIVSATGSGKSLVLYLNTRFALESMGKKKVLIIVPTINLVTQLRDDFLTYSGDEEWTESTVHMLYGGEQKDVGKKVTISTYQSLMKQEASFYHRYDTVIVDEAHTAKSKTITAILEECVSADIRYGTTGTLDHHTLHGATLEGLFSRPEVTSTTRELIDEGVLANPKITALRVVHTATKLVSKGWAYLDELNFIRNDPRRNEFIAKIAANRNGNVLVMVTHIDHGKMLLETIRKEVEGTGKEVYFINSSTKPKERERVRKLCESKDGVIIISIWKVFSTGINIVNLDHVILGAPLKAEITIMQTLGRVLRRSETKTEATMVDVCDDVAFGKKQGVLVRQFIERVKFYQKANLDIQTLTITL